MPTRSPRRSGAPRPIPSRCRSDEKGLERAARGRQSGRHLCRARRDQQGRGAAASSAARSSRPSSPRWPISPSRSSAPINAEMRRLVADPAYIDSVLADGAARAQVTRRRDHESGQGHRRLRAALSGNSTDCNTSAPRCRALVPRAERRGTDCSEIAPRGADEHEAPQLRGRSLAEIPGRHRRHAGMRPRALFRQPPRAAHRRHRDHAARDRDPRPQPAMARRRRHHARGGARGGERRARPPRQPRLEHHRRHAGARDPRRRQGARRSSI